MASGTSTYMGLAVPLFGECIVTQTTGGTDIMTIEGANGQTGDFLVIRDSTETERLVVEDGGNIVMTQKAAADVGLKIVRYTGATANAITVTDNSGSTAQFEVCNDGEVIITQQAAGDVGLKILRYTAPSTDGFKVAANDDSATKRFAITKNYNPALRVLTTRPTTGLTKGEMLLLFHGSKPYLGICSSTAGQQIKLVRCKTKTFGRLTA